jgi:hypothetical protein
MPFPIATAGPRADADGVAAVEAVPVGVTDGLDNGLAEGVVEGVDDGLAPQPVSMAATAAPRTSRDLSSMDRC